MVPEMSTSDRVAVAKRHLEHAQEQISFAESARTDNARMHHVTIAKQHLLLAEKELVAADQAAK